MLGVFLFSRLQITNYTMKTMLTYVLCAFFIFAQAQDDSNTEKATVIEGAITMDDINKVVDSINNSFTYQYGKIELNGVVATLNVPAGFKYLDPEQSKRVLTDLWENPPSPTLGLLFPENAHPVGENLSYAVEITYAEDGYIDDSDAKDIDYDELLEQMKEDAKAQSEQRLKLGYGAMEFVGWASTPFYDEESKKLHWAKEIKFSESDVNTLNYNIRVLGRKGCMNLNVIGDMTVLPQVNKDIDNILSSVEFNTGFKYSEFNPDVDEVAAYGIGGLIAGKVLAKAGFFALLVKFWKFIALGVVGIFSVFKKKIFGGKDKE